MSARSAGAFGRAEANDFAEVDAFRPAVHLGHCDVLWAIQVLSDEPLPLLTAASQAQSEPGQDGAEPPTSELVEPAVVLRLMPAGREVVENYRHTGLTLRQHPVSFLREDLARRHALTCAEAGALRDRSPVRLPGLVLVRQKPGSAKGVLFITVEDETGRCQRDPA